MWPKIILHLLASFFIGAQTLSASPAAVRGSGLEASNLEKSASFGDTVGWFYNPELRTWVYNISPDPGGWMYFVNTAKNEGCSISLTEESGFIRVQLENEVIKAVYSPNSGANGFEYYLSEFVDKEVNINSAFCDLKSVVGLDGAAWRGVITNAVIVEDEPDSKTVRLDFDGIQGRPTWNVEVTIVSNQPWLKIRYLKYYVNVVDQGCPGGTNNAEVVFHGGDEWMELRSWDKVPLYVGGSSNVPFFNATDNYADRRRDTPGPLDYNGCFIMGLYNPINDVGFGRVVPNDLISGINILSGATGPRGFEVLTAWGMDKVPYTQYLFLFQNGKEGLLSAGRAIADNLP